MATGKTALALMTAALLALAAPAASDQSEMVEVVMNVEFGGDSVQPIVLVKAGETADIQFTYDPDYGQIADLPRRTHEEAPVDEDARRDHRLLLVVDSLGDSGGYLAATEYMSRLDGKWTSQMLPRMALKPDSEASVEFEAEEGQLSRIGLTLLPRPDLGSLEDAKLSYFHSNGQRCHTVPESASTDSLGADELQSSCASASDCCTIKCGPFKMRCCNACCSDSHNCPGVSCCAGDHPGASATFPGSP